MDRVSGKDLLLWGALAVGIYMIWQAVSKPSPTLQRKPMPLPFSPLMLAPISLPDFTTPAVEFPTGNTPPIVPLSEQYPSGA